MDKRSKILIVDDNSENIRVLIEVLKRDYQLNAATNGFKALELAKSWDPDLILLDVIMPGMGGLDVCANLAADKFTKDIPVVFVSAVDDPNEKLMCIKVGALDYITKPIDQELLKAKIRNLVAIKNDRRILSSILEDKKDAIDQSEHPLVYMTLTLAEFRDKTHGKWHIKRCVEYAKVLIKSLLKDVDYKELVKGSVATAIINAVPYHDIGKSMLPDNIILKPDRLTPEEFEQMKNHVKLDGDLLESISAAFDDDVYTSTTLEMISSHHERWDGTGYPYGLTKKNIPLSGRIMAIIDQYDALVSSRVYKKPSYHFEAVKIVSSESGKGLDPALVSVFLEVQDEFFEILKKYSDEDIISEEE